MIASIPTTKMRKGLLLGAASLRELSARLAPTCPSSGWVATSVDKQQGMWERMLTRLSLRALHSHHRFDLPEFLEGSRHAYCVCSKLIRQKRWPELSSLVSPSYYEAVAQTFTADVHPDCHDDDPIRIVSSVLTRARTGGSDHRDAHLEVRFRAWQMTTFDDLTRSDSLSEPLSGQLRLQESKWTFERCMSDDNAATGWQVTKIKWRVRAEQELQIRPSIPTFRSPELCVMLNRRSSTASSALSAKSSALSWRSQFAHLATLAGASDPISSECKD